MHGNKSFPTMRLGLIADIHGNADALRLALDALEPICDRIICAGDALDARKRCGLLRRVLATWRSVNAYHLFVHMTRVRNEPVIEGSVDGATWQSYEFHYKPGDVDRAPPFVAPHQPRVDFLLWFLTLGGRTSAPYFETLLARLVEDPAAVAPLFDGERRSGWGSRRLS